MCIALVQFCWRRIIRQLKWLQVTEDIVAKRLGHNYCSTCFSVMLLLFLTYSNFRGAPPMSQHGPTFSGPPPNSSHISVNVSGPPMLLNRPPMASGPPAMMARAGAPPLMMMSTVQPLNQQSAQVKSTGEDFLRCFWVRSPNSSLRSY